jgi:uncharacterized protein (TIGR02117 family)
MRMAWLVAVLLLAGCAPALERGAPPASRGAGPHVWLVGHGWHVGLVVRMADVPAGRWPESNRLGASTHVEVGWGDADFYPAPRGTAALALRAALRSRGSVLHVVGFDEPVDVFFPASEIVEVALSARGLEALVDFVRRAYARDGAGQPIEVAPALYGRGWFYEATGRYALFENSNRWTAQSLQAAGCPLDPGDVLTAGTLLESARRFGRVIRGPGAGTVTAQTVCKISPTGNSGASAWRQSASRGSTPSAARNA